jgi:flagellar hook assembly protein FlgD
VGKDLAERENDPCAIRLLGNRPNPFNPSTTIEFVTPGGSLDALRVRLTVHDVSGRRVKVLVDSDVAPGHHSAYWDGRDAQGRPVSAGIYFSVLTAGDKTLSRKMTLLE